MSSTDRAPSKPFTTSPSAGGILTAVAVLLLGGGLIPILGLPADTAVPLVLACGVVIVLVSLVTGMADHPAEIILSAVLLPAAGWGYVFAILYASTRPMMGGVLVTGGLGFVAWAIVRAFKSRAEVGMSRHSVAETGKQAAA